MLERDDLTVFRPMPMEGFVETPYIKEISKRAWTYLQAGFPIHFRGPAGTGKTTLALHIASKLNRPVMLIHGDDEFGTSDLIGGQYGMRIRKVIDNFIHSVLKTEEDMMRRWVDNRLTVACQHGFTLVYDEFNRSHPEANNVLLSILEEGLLELPRVRGGEDYMKVHPEFKAIFTSNPEEYAGIHKTQDALQDRMITLDLGYYDRETEIAIAKSKAQISREKAVCIVDIVREFRERKDGQSLPTIRASIMIAKALNHLNGKVKIGDHRFRQICSDVLAPGRIKDHILNTKEESQAIIDQLIQKYCQNKKGFVQCKNH